MRAEKEDAPEYLHRKKSAAWQMMAFIGVGSAITWGLIALFAKPIVINIDTLKQAVRFADEPAQEVSAALESQKVQALQELVADTGGQRQAPNNYIISHDEPSAEELTGQLFSGAPRQTSFNDSNYRPRTDVNTIQAPKPVQYAANNSSRSNQQATRRNNSASWTWVGADRKRQPIYIHWMTSNGWIEFDTVCHNHRRGSIEYRDCRKAAKEYFRHRCKTENRQAFCLAENRYYP